MNGHRDPPTSTHARRPSGTAGAAGRLLTGLLGLLVAGQAAAQAVTLTYEGDLSDLAGVPIEADLPMSFRLYAEPDGGDPLWSEDEQVPVLAGRFTVVLGDDLPFPALDPALPLFLAVQVADDVEQSPRLRVGGALRAKWAEVAGQALDVEGRAIHPASVAIGDAPVIDEQGRWVGDPTGLIGPVGPAGADGPAGPRGEIGPAGPPGEIGPAGAAGPIGPVGPEGPAGPPGEIGPVGPAGPAGPPGEIGPVGPAGPQGEIGPVGPAGPQGEIGPVGPAGPQGEIGPAGPAGPAGPQGEIGPAGRAGPQGEVGPAGRQGVAGPAGPQGPAGPAGADGAVGPAGAVGPQGPAGSFEPPPLADAIFGVGPIALYAGGQWVLEAVDSNTIQVRQTDGGFIPVSIMHPANCAGNASTMQQAHRFLSAVGQTLTADLCAEGSTALVTIWRSGDLHPATIRCMRYTGNHVRCQRML